jgi:hypothetical protein
MTLPNDVHPEDKAFFESAVRILDTLQTMTPYDARLVIQLAWTVLAKRCRDEALAQIGQLEKIAALVREDTPDMELERLVQDGDIQGALNHIRKSINEEGGE